MFSFFENMDKPPVIGIDLGTSNSCVAVWQYGMVEVIANELGSKTTPATVAFNGNERMVGQSAKNLIEQNVANLENVVCNVKRIIGRKFDDEKLQQDLKHFTFNVMNERNKPCI